MLGKAARNTQFRRSSFFIIVYVRIALVRLVEVKYSKTLSAYLFYSFFCKKIGRCVLCTHLLNLFNVNK